MITKHVRAYAVRNTGKIYLISNTAIHRVQYKVHTSVQVMPVTLCMIKQSPQGTCIFAEYTCKTMKYCSISRASFHIKKKNHTNCGVSLSHRRCRTGWCNLPNRGRALLQICSRGADWHIVRDFCTRQVARAARRRCSRAVLPWIGWPWQGRGARLCPPGEGSRCGASCPSGRGCSAHRLSERPPSLWYSLWRDRDIPDWCLFAILSASVTPTLSERLEAHSKRNQAHFVHKSHTQRFN